MTVTAIPDGSLAYSGFAPIPPGSAVFIPCGGISYIGQILVFGASQDITKIHLPPPNVPFVTADGKIKPEWYRFLENLYRRVGGAEEDLVAQSAIIAQNAAAAVTTAVESNTALAETVATISVSVDANSQYIENYGPRIKSLEDSY